MKVLIVQNFLSSESTGGVETYLRDIIPVLSERGHHIYLLVASYSGNYSVNVAGTLRTIKIENDKRALRTPLSKAKWLLVSRYNYFATKQAIKACKPDVLYFHNLEWVTNSPLLAAAESGIRFVVHAHNHLYNTLFVQPMSWLTRLASPVFKNNCPRVIPTIIAVSKYIENGIQIGQSETTRNPLTIYNGIPEKAFSGESLEIKRKPSVLFAGALSPHKGVHIAIQAVIEANKRHRIEMQIAGQTGNLEYISKCREIIGNNNANEYISFIGKTERRVLWNLMQRVECLLFPSIWDEPFGLVAAEAMANGAIVIGSNRGAIPEVVGESGMLVDPEPCSIAKAMCSLFEMDENERLMLRILAYERVRKMFTFDKNIIEVERILGK